MFPTRGAFFDLEKKRHVPNEGSLFDSYGILFSFGINMTKRCTHARYIWPIENDNFFLSNTYGMQGCCIFFSKLFTQRTLLKYFDS